MASWRTAFSLDVIQDHDLIQRLVELKRDGQASQTIRTALREYFNNDGGDLDAVLQKLNLLLEKMEKLEKMMQNGITVNETAKVKEEDIEEIASAARNLDAMLSRFKV